MGLFANIFGRSKMTDSALGTIAEASSTPEEKPVSYEYELPLDDWYVDEEPPICKCGATARPWELSDDEDRTWECPNCGMCMWVNNDIVEYDTDDYDYDDVYGKNPGCSACDNPNYPMCKDSCPMFD